MLIRFQALSYFNHVQLTIIYSDTETVGTATSFKPRPWQWSSKGWRFSKTGIYQVILWWRMQGRWWSSRNEIALVLTLFFFVYLAVVLIIVQIHILTTNIRLKCTGSYEYSVATKNKKKTTIVIKMSKKELTKVNWIVNIRLYKFLEISAISDFA